MKAEAAKSKGQSAQHMELETHIFGRTSGGENLVNRLKRQGQRLQREMYVAFLLFKHAQTPWYARAVAAFPIAYQLSPIQLIPCFIPVVGMLDDLFVLLLSMKLAYQLAPTQVVAECRERALTVEAGQNSELKIFTVVCATVLIIFWIFSATVGMWFLAHNHHHMDK